ncbi:MAG TPA: 3-hydroxyacyl-CoA dehydrogenase NAD-binding domain-containing protein [Gaiellaceae bacterium]|nr:3-hydroxyacyl-CoA dehydrogenase NAD-binding domain-containing protein [Gaiellaceae bacterium]
MSDPAVVVVGPGRMGVGIAQALAVAGLAVRLVDVKTRPVAESEAALVGARARIASGLAQLAAVGFVAGDGADELRRVEYVSVGGAEDALAAADVVFEAVPETVEAKDSAYRRIGMCGALIGSTTSTFGVDDLAARVGDPSRFMNTHWLNPAPVIPLVEVMPGTATAEASVVEMEALLQAVGKVPVRCAASAGYIVPRIQALAMNEAARIVEEGVADAEAVDLACRLGFGVRFATMGLLEFVDWGGADVLLYASDYLEGALGSDRFAAPAIVADKVRSGALGLKTGAGFHDYGARDLDAYQREQLRALVELLAHLRRG